MWTRGSSSVAIGQSRSPVHRTKYYTLKGHRGNRAHPFLELNICTHPETRARRACFAMHRSGRSILLPSLQGYHVNHHGKFSYFFKFNFGPKLSKVAWCTVQRNLFRTSLCECEQWNPSPVAVLILRSTKYRLRAVLDVPSPSVFGCSTNIDFRDRRYTYKLRLE